MSTLQEYLLVIGAFQGCLLFGLLMFDARLSTASRVLGAICLLMASALLQPFLLRAVPGPLMWLIGWIFYLPASSGALAYLYCRSALLDQPLRLRDAALFTPWIACYVLTADISLAAPEEMVRWIQGAAPTSWRLQVSEYLLFAQAFAFAGVTIKMIASYGRQARQALANFNPLIFRWMLILQVFTLLIWILNALPALTQAPVVFAQLANLVIVVFIYFIAISQWRTPQLFTIPNLSSEQAAASAEPQPDKPSSESGELDPALRAQLFESITAELESNALFLDSQLTLSGLADATGLSRHQVSEVLNKHAGKNFYEFVNGYRIKAVCKRLEEEPEAKILDVALETGFSSKSTFNAIFKQFTGQTPTQYRQNMSARV